MIKFTDLPKLIKELKTTKVRVHDSNDDLLYKVAGSTVEQTIAKLKDLESILKTYGRVYLYAANEVIEKGRWKGAYKWEVAFSDDASPATIGKQAVTPTATEREHKLEMKLKEMEWEIKNEKRFKELEEKLARKEKKQSFDPVMLLPLVGDALGMAPDKISKYMKMMKGDFSQPVTQTSLAGAGTEEQLQITPQEQEQKQNAINKEIEGIFLKTGPDKILALMKGLNELTTKSDCDKIITLVNALNNKPEFVDQALIFIQ